MSDTDAARLIRVLSLSLTCSLVLENKPDSCDVVMTLCLTAVVPVFGARGLSFLVFMALETGQCPTSNGSPHDTRSNIFIIFFLVAFLDQD